MSGTVEGGWSPQLGDEKTHSVPKSVNSAVSATLWLGALLVLVIAISGLVSLVVVTVLHKNDSSETAGLQRRVLLLEEQIQILIEKCNTRSVEFANFDGDDGDLDSEEASEDDDLEAEDYRIIETDDHNKALAAEGRERVVRLKREATSPPRKHRKSKKRKGKNRKKSCKCPQKKSGQVFSEMKNSTEFKEYHPTAFHLMGNLPELTPRQREDFEAGRDVKLGSRDGTLNKRKGYRPDSDGVYRRWKPADWSKEHYGSDYSYNADSGELTVKKEGVYFIYSQITRRSEAVSDPQILFNNAASRSSHAVKVDGETFMQCVQSVDYVTEGSDAKYKTCYVGGTHYLRPETKIKVVDQYKDRWVNFAKESSYWGVIKLAGS